MKLVVAYFLPRPARLRRAGWVVACLWLMAALMPLRAWAMAGMGLAVSDTTITTAVTAAVDLPPCHAATGDDAGPTADHSTCSQCVFCAPVLAGTLPESASLPHPNIPPPATAAGPAPTVAPESLFRPPRG